jgi:hypothetical protein
MRPLPHPPRHRPSTPELDVIRMRRHHQRPGRRPVLHLSTPRSSTNSGTPASKEPQRPRNPSVQGTPASKGLRVFPPHRAAYCRLLVQCLPGVRAGHWSEGMALRGRLPTGREETDDLALVMSGSFVHKSIVASCGRSIDILASGPRRGRHYATHHYQPQIVTTRRLTILGLVALSALGIFLATHEENPAQLQPDLTDPPTRTVHTNPTTQSRDRIPPSRNSEDPRGGISFTKS